MPAKRLLLLSMLTGLSVAGSLAVAEWIWRRAVRSAYEQQLSAFDNWLLVPDREHGCRYAFRPGVDEVREVASSSGTQKVRCRVQADGLRHHEVWPPPAGVPRVLFIGDSYTFGVGVGDGVSFSHACERQLRESGIECRAVNAGVPGYNSEQELARMRQLLPVLEPRIVVLGFLPNDAEPVSYVDPPPDELHGWSARADVERPSVNQASGGLINRDWIVAYQSHGNDPLSLPWTIYMRQVRGTGSMSTPYWILGTEPFHVMTPQVAGSNGRYLMAFTTSLAQPGVWPGVDIGETVRVRRFNWDYGSPNPTYPWPAQPVDAMPAPTFQLGAWATIATLVASGC